jgi:nucleotide-binding universal stress UspA family protein
MNTSEVNMKELAKILVATDLTPESQDVISLGATIARKFHSQIILITVIPDIHTSSIAPDAIKQGVAKLLKEAQENILKEGIASVEAEVATGSAYDQIVKHAIDRDVNLVVIGAGDKKETDKFQLGVTAEKVMRACPKPVWVTKKGCSPDLENILVPVDFSEASNRALRNAAVLARNFGAKLTVLHVVEGLSNIYPGRPLVKPEEQGNFKKEQETEFAKFLQGFDFQGVNWTKTVSMGDPSEEILKAARGMNSPLIIMGSEGRTGLSRILMGNVAEKVVREVPCSMVTVKSSDSMFSR